MRRSTVLSFLLLAALAVPARADEAAPVRGPRAAVRSAIIDARDKILDLARAMPAEKYDWRPGPGVRSAGEVYRHVAQGNYFLCTFLGIKVPEGVTLKDMDTTPLDKAKTIELVERSYDHALGAVSSIPDAALADTLNFFGRPSTKMDVLMAIATHNHEHLGQSIAYARSNGVVPPWTAKAEEAAKAKAKAKS
jgi:uncharacterized damage-inducible protein DinB